MNGDRACNPAPDDFTASIIPRATSYSLDAAYGDRVADRDTVVAVVAGVLGEGADGDLGADADGVADGEGQHRGLAHGDAP